MKDEIQKDEGTEITLAIPSQTDLEAAFTKGEIDTLVTSIEVEVRKHAPDLSSDKGRKAIASLAHKVARSKSPIDEARKSLTEGWRTKTKEVNDAWKGIETRLNNLRDEVRQPLQDWEVKDEERKVAHRARLALLQKDRTQHTMSVAEITTIIDEVEAIEIDDSWDEFQKMAGEAKEEGLASFRNDLSSAQIREDQAAEIAALKEQQAEQERRAEEERAAREAKEAEEAAERAKAEAAEREEREAKEKVDREEREALERAEKEEADRIQQEAEEEQRKSDLADDLVAHVKAAAAGTINGEVQPFGVLEYEINRKVPEYKADLGEHWTRVQASIDAAKPLLEALRAEAEAEQRAEQERIDQEREAAHQAQLKEAAEKERRRLALIEEEQEQARAQRAADDKHRERVLKRVTDAMAPFPAEELAQAILDGKIPHVKMEL